MNIKNRVSVFTEPYVQCLLNDIVRKLYICVLLRVCMKKEKKIVWFCAYKIKHGELESKFVTLPLSKEKQEK